MVMNSSFISGKSWRVLPSCLPGLLKPHRQGCSSFLLGLKYTKQNPHSLLYDFLCPRAADVLFLPSIYVPSLILLDFF